MKSVDFEELLDQCLLRLADGESLEDILAEHPLQAEELRQLLPLAGAYQTATPPAPSLVGRSQGKQAMLAAFDEAFPARQASWWERLWSGPGRPLIYAGGALAAVAIILVAVLALRTPGTSVADIPPTDAVAVAIVPTEAVTELIEAEVAELPTEIVPTASPEPLPTATPVPEEPRNGDTAVAAAVEFEEEALTATSEPAGTQPAPAAAAPPVGGNSTGAAESAPIAGEWLVIALNGNVLAEPFVITMNTDGSINIVTECGDLAGQYSASANMLTIFALAFSPADGCTPEAEQLVDELRLALEAIINWEGELMESISLQDGAGNTLLEMSRALE